MKHAGELVPRTGLYRVNHHHHRTAHHAILWQSETFPSCRICGDAVTFEFLQPMPESNEFEHVGYDGDFLESVLGSWEKDYAQLSA